MRGQRRMSKGPGLRALLGVVALGIVAPGVVGCGGEGDGRPEDGSAVEGTSEAVGAPDEGRAGADAVMVAAVDGLAGPEAVRYDPDQDVYFVANFGPRSDESRDRNGFISRVAPDGGVEALRFIEGSRDQPLHMPRGMAIAGDTLWVADVDGVHGFHRRDGGRLAFIDFTAHEPGFLNDIAVGPDGALYVTDSGKARVYRAAGGTAEVAIEDTLTGPPNGITWDAGRSAFLLAPWGGGQVIRSWTAESGLRDVVSVPGGRFDGIEVVGGSIVVASQTDSTIWVVRDGEPRAAVRVEGAPADIGVDTRRGHVAVPYIARDRVEIWRVPGVSAAGPGGR